MKKYFAVPLLSLLVGINCYAEGTPGSASTGGTRANGAIGSNSATVGTGLNTGDTSVRQQSGNLNQNRDSGWAPRDSATNPSNLRREGVRGRFDSSLPGGTSLETVPQRAPTPRVRMDNGANVDSATQRSRELESNSGKISPDNFGRPNL